MIQGEDTTEAGKRQSPEVARQAVSLVSKPTEVNTPLLSSLRGGHLLSLHSFVFPVFPSTLDKPHPTEAPRA